MVARAHRERLPVAGHRPLGRNVPHQRQIGPPQRRRPVVQRHAHRHEHVRAAARTVVLDAVEPDPPGQVHLLAQLIGGPEVGADRPPVRLVVARLLGEPDPGVEVDQRRRPPAHPGVQPVALGLVGLGPARQEPVRPQRRGERRLRAQPVGRRHPQAQVVLADERVAVIAVVALVVAVVERHRRLELRPRIAGLAGRPDVVAVARRGVQVVHPPERPARRHEPVAAHRPVAHRRRQREHDVVLLLPIRPAAPAPRVRVIVDAGRRPERPPLQQVRQRRPARDRRRLIPARQRHQPVLRPYPARHPPRRRQPDTRSNHPPHDAPPYQPRPRPANTDRPPAPPRPAPPRPAGPPRRPAPPARPDCPPGLPAGIALAAAVPGRQLPIADHPPCLIC